MPRLFGSAWATADGVQKACLVGSAAYTLYSLYKVFSKTPKFSSSTKDVPPEELRTSLAVAQLVSVCGAGCALSGVLAFKKYDSIPLWIPLAGGAATILGYVTSAWEDLFSARNNAFLLRNSAVLMLSSFFGGWAAGPVAVFVQDFLFYFYAPVSLAAITGYAVATQTVSSNGLLLLIHGPIAATCFGGGVGALVPVSVTAADHLKASSVAAALLSSMGGSVLMTLHGCIVLNNISLSSCVQQLLESPLTVLHKGFTTTKKKDEEEGIDIASTALVYILSGAALFYQASKRIVRRGVKVIRGEKAGKKCCRFIDYDSLGASIIVSTIVMMIYYRSLVVLEQQVARPRRYRY